ncbi:hypothetical protein Bca52824_059673 [Brassica carinata]|uniref:Uncharacterized protein n=1 Tax=Brassica carinata TaxID=52824 RepID=A0A8X7QUV1_BRACI|nr:hypothetical protein Bca52824_059673 [Brassica carinata]
MIPRRWEPGIGAGDWFGLFWHDQDLDTAYQNCYSGRLRMDLGIKKGICGILRKVKIWVEWRWIAIIITMKSPINTARSGDINLQRYGIAEDYYWNENMENWKRYNKMRRIQKASPERRRENRKGNGGWTDGAKHEERARSYKGVVINSNTGQQNRERDSREYYGKGKGKMVEASDSKWVKVPERGTRRPPNQYGNYREDVTVVDSGAQVVSTRSYAAQPREDQGQQVAPQVTREEGEITRNGDADATLPSAEFQMELAKTQAEGSEVIVEATEEERGLLTVQGMMEKQYDTFEDIDIELDAINAAMMESGVDLEREEEFQTLSEEELEQASEAQAEFKHQQGIGTGDLATRKSHRKRLFKPTSSTAGSTKMRMASALVSPRRKVAAKVGARHGDNTKPPENKGPSIPKPVLSRKIWKCGNIWCAITDYFLTVSRFLGDMELVRYVWGVFYVNRGWWINWTREHGALLVGAKKHKEHADERCN